MQTPKPHSPPETVEPARLAGRLVVVGLGMTAYKLIERMQALNALKRYDVTIIGEENYPAYDRVHLTEWLEHRDAQRLALGPPGWAEAAGIRIVAGNAATSIDRGRRTVRLAGGERIGYDHLVLATGSAPFVPPIEGANAENVFVYRTIDDLRRIGRRAEQARKAIVIGGGPLGLEIAAALRRLGPEIVVLEAAPYLMCGHLDIAGAAVLNDKIRKMGIRAIAPVLARRIEAEGDRLRLFVQQLDDPLTADMIVMATGIQPRDELAQDAGLAVASVFGGVVVDDTLRTTDPAIYAIGECARHRDALYGLIAPGYRMAETLAEMLAGREKRFSGYTPAIRLRLMDADVWAMGDQDQPGKRIRWNERGAYRQITVWRNRVVAASSVDAWAERGFVQDIIRKRKRIRRRQLNRFRRTGALSRRSAHAPPNEWPSSTIVCNCMEITRGALDKAIAQGCASVEALAEHTGASTVCGSCKPLLAELTGSAPAPAEDQKRTGLLVTAAIAVALTLMIAFGPPIPLADSVLDQGIWDTLRRDSGWRWGTGFILLGCALISAGFSLRKRWKRVRWGNIAWWRVGHGAVGVLALIALVAHTGLHTGSGWNRMLTISFLAASAFGGAAAAGMGSQRTRLGFWLHVLLIWPLPILIFFHILAAWYF